MVTYKLQPKFLGPFWRHRRARTFGRRILPQSFLSSIVFIIAFTYFQVFFIIAFLSSIVFVIAYLIVKYCFHYCLNLFPRIVFIIAYLSRITFLVVYLSSTVIIIALTYFQVFSQVFLAKVLFIILAYLQVVKTVIECHRHGVLHR